MKSGTLSLHSEPYGSTGNIGENFQRLLGSPSLDPLQTVIREAVQNIADAALSKIGPAIEIRLRTLTTAQRHVLTSRVLSELPEERRSKKRLSATLSRKNLTVMEICDFGTLGLGGPTRADRIPAGEKTTDFIDFLRNVGVARDTDQGGGTYGFGKVTLYRASKCSTIIVDTLPSGTGPCGRRLMGCHVGRSFDLPDKRFNHRYTGRHWWGVPDPDSSIVEPVTGTDANRLASALGFPDRTIRRRSIRRSGTSIMILDFDTQGEDLGLVGNRIVEGLLWNFWPRMMDDTPPYQRFTCRVEVNGIPLRIPSPEDFPPLDMFSKAMRTVRTGTRSDVRRISHKGLQKELGTLAIERGLRAQRRPLVEEGSLFPPLASHIALMRPVALVVKYLEGTPIADEQFEWAGVFVASREAEVERAFADSEPPAHDDWIPNNFPRGSRAKTLVNVALTNLKSIASEMGTTTSGHPDNPDTGPPLARVAGRLGIALAGTSGDGAGRTRATTRGSRARRPARARASRPLFERLERSGTDKVAVFSTEVHQDARRSGSSLVARAAVVIEGAGATRTDQDIRQPVVLSIRSTDSSAAAGTDSLDLDGNEGDFEIRVVVPDDCAVTVDAEVLSRT